MELTEEKAKEILNFLAKQSGDQTITLGFKKNYLLLHDADEVWHLELCFHDSEKTDKHLRFKKSYLETTNFGDPISIGSCSCKAYLDKLLELSRNGYDIMIFNRAQMFLKKNTSLEEILVEMDLSTTIE